MHSIYSILIVPLLLFFRGLFVPESVSDVCRATPQIQRKAGNITHAWDLKERREISHFRQFTTVHYMWSRRSIVVGEHYWLPLEWGKKTPKNVTILPWNTDFSIFTPLSITGPTSNVAHGQGWHSRREETSQEIHYTVPWNKMCVFHCLGRLMGEVLLQPGSICRKPCAGCFLSSMCMLEVGMEQ